MLKKLTGNPLPSHAHVEVSGRCQLDCVYCSRKLRESAKPKMTLLEFKGVLDQIPTLKGVTLTIMNEALLNDEIVDIVAEAKRRNIRVGFPTNGVTFPADMQDGLLRVGLNSIAFSIDTLDPDVFRKTRRPAELNVVLDNLTSFHEKRNSRNAGTRIFVTCVLTPETLAGIEVFTEDLTARGADCVQYRFPHQWTPDAGTDVSFVSTEQALEGMREAKKKFGRKIHYYYRPYAFSRIQCPRPFNSVGIKVDGEVVPCCLQASDPELVSMGNITGRGFKELWDSPEYQEFRRPFLEGAYPEVCAGCTVLRGVNGNPAAGLLDAAGNQLLSLLCASRTLSRPLGRCLQKFPL